MRTQSEVARSIETLYKDGYKDPSYHHLDVPGCPAGVPCPLPAFLARSNPYFPTDIVQEYTRAYNHPFLTSSGHDKVQQGGAPRGAHL